MSQRQSISGEWSSSFAFVLAATGSAVGLGNIWKFPYIAGENGGGAFVLVYLICITMLGLPIMIAEILIGRRGRQNPANTMRTLAVESERNQLWRLVGGLTILAGFLILSYYSVIAGWAVDYVYQAAAGHFNQATPAQINQLFTSLISHPGRLLFWHSCIMFTTILVVAQGVQHGIERSVRYLFPAMVILLLVIVAYSINSGFFGRGFSFLFHPNFKALSPNAILIALGHAFFTLSLATGSIMMYGAYLPRGASIPRAALYIALADTFIALLAGMAIFPLVFAHGLAPGAGPGLIFKTLPIAFGQMPYGQFFGALFFIMLVLAAFTSAISLLEPSVSWLIENRSLTRVKAAIFAGSAIWALGLGTILSFNLSADVKFFGLNFFELIDYLTANIMLPLGGLLIAVFAAWRFRRHNILDEFDIKKPSWLYWSWHYCLGIAVPILILFVFLHVLGYI